MHADRLRATPACYVYSMQEWLVVCMQEWELLIVCMQEWLIHAGVARILTYSLHAGMAHAGMARCLHAGVAHIYSMQEWLVDSYNKNPK